MARTGHDRRRTIVPPGVVSREARVRALEAAAAKAADDDSDAASDAPRSRVHKRCAWAERAEPAAGAEDGDADADAGGGGADADADMSAPRGAAGAPAAEGAGGDMSSPPPSQSPQAYAQA